MKDSHSALADLQLLSKGLNFAPTLTNKNDPAKLIAQYDNYANSIRKIVNNRTKHDTQEPHTPTNHETLTGLIHPKMKFILNQDTQRLIASPLVEGYINETKEILLNHVIKIFCQRKTNTPANELK